MGILVEASVSILRFVIGAISKIFNSIPSKKCNPPPILYSKLKCLKGVVTILNVLSVVCMNEVFLTF